MSNFPVEQFGTEPPLQKRSWPKAVWRGGLKKCPNCGTSGLFKGYTQTNEKCDTCGLDFTHHRADDAPPYFTIMIVGHIMIPLALAVKQLFSPPLWAQFLIWGPFLIIATIWFLPISKGALIGLQWANRMHGFSEKPETPSTEY